MSPALAFGWRSSSTSLREMPKSQRCKLVAAVSEEQKYYKNNSKLSSLDARELPISINSTSLVFTVVSLCRTTHYVDKIYIE
jgi:hypothetical protein